MSDTKVCTKCMEEKPLSEYYLRSDGKGVMRQRYICKVCHSADSKRRRDQPGDKEKKRERSRKWYAENREHARARNKEYQHKHKHPEIGKASHVRYKAKKRQIRDWLVKTYSGVPCMDCDGVFVWCSMDFDHRLGEVKEFGIGWISNLKATPERVAQTQKEIAKCDLVCSNCHRVRTQERYDAEPQS